MMHEIYVHVHRRPPDVVRDAAHDNTALDRAFSLESALVHCQQHDIVSNLRLRGKAFVTESDL